MLYDAIKRGAPEYWRIIVLVPFGEIAYFLAIKLPDLRYRSGFSGQLFAKRVSLADLRHELEVTPSLVNRVGLAQALHDQGQYKEAGELFREILEQSNEDKDALYGYARCALAQERDSAAEAKELLTSGLRSYDTGPRFARRLDRAAARDARALLKTL